MLSQMRSHHHLKCVNTFLNIFDDHIRMKTITGSDWADGGEKTFRKRQSSSATP